MLTSHIALQKERLLYIFPLFSLVTNSGKYVCICCSMQTDVCVCAREYIYVVYYPNTTRWPHWQWPCYLIFQHMHMKSHKSPARISGPFVGRISWWRHQMATFSALLAFVRGNHRLPVKSPHKGQWRGALIFSLIWAWTNGWVNNRDAGDVRRHRAHYNVTVVLMAIVGLKVV